ncbi:MAG TPA: PKD domain-containing protein [Candidatus Thermoplasmatota archaeon]|nr:PKD domain-containing protein [Candidatus Thermoplasmatota archaeon]
MLVRSSIRPSVCLRTLGLAALLLASGLVAPSAGAASSSAAPLGMDMGSVRALQDAGVAPRYGSYWVGHWMASSGWAGLDNALDRRHARGDGRTQAQWTSMTATLADHLKTKLAGREVLVVLENEFNKGGVSGSAYAPTFDAKLEAVAKTLKAVPGVKIVLGFGGWAEGDWSRFPKSINASDLIGFQAMRASTKDGESSYRGVVDRVAALSLHVNRSFAKPSFLYDLALSSYPNASYEAIQAQTLDRVLALLGAPAGVQGMVYRELRDNPSMGDWNYYGVAEQFWGFKRTDGTWKPAWDVWRAASQRAAGAIAVPGAVEAEAMPSTAGGRTSNASASGGAAWNLWSNGALSARLAPASAGEYRVLVRAAGQSAAGVDARMEVRVNGAAVQSFSVAPGAWRDHLVEVRLDGSAFDLAVAFTNDEVVNGQDRNLLVDQVRVEANRAPVAAFSFAASGMRVSFDASASSDPEGRALSYAWSFGDGSAGAGATAERAYARGGDYPVTLTVSDGRSSASATQVVRVNSPPEARMQISTTGLTVVADGRASSDPDGDALSYAWSFGDGATSPDALATHTYAAPGDYAVTLVVSDGRASSSASGTARAVSPNAPPLASFTDSAEWLQARFDASGSKDPDGDALTFSWSFGDGTTGAGAVVDRAYAAPGSYLVRVVVSDGRAVSEASRTVAVSYPAPVASASARGGGGLFAFDANGSADPAGGNLTYRWDFGDGASSTAAAPSHAYAPGNHTATLTVTNRFGAVARATVAVEARAFAAAFDPLGKGNQWWVQTAVDANEPLASVCASIDGGACQALKLQSWGEWAASLRASAGARVVFTALSVTGARVASEAFAWTTGKPYMTVDWKPSGNSWWVQNDLVATSKVASVCASVNGGACQPLKPQSWGGWAASMRVQKGAVVTFTARSVDNEVVTSAGVAWPPK